jgi:hypothetical protein
MDVLQSQEFPEHVVSAVGEGRWLDLEAALRSGLPAHLSSGAYGMSLFEFVLAHQDGSSLEQEEEGLPFSLLQAFLEQRGAAGAGSPWLSLALKRGQWGWANGLLDGGWPAEDGAEGSLHALVRGVLRQQQLATLARVGQLLHELLLPSEEGHPEAVDGEIFFKRLATHWAGLQGSPSDLSEPLALVDRLVGMGASLCVPAPAPRWREVVEVWPVHQALRSSSPGLTWVLLEHHERSGMALPEGMLGFAVRHASIPSFKALLSHGLVHRLPEAELAQAAFVSVGRPLPGVLLGLEAAGLRLEACRDGEGWDLMQRAAQAGSVSALLVMNQRGQGLEAEREVGPTPGDLLRLNHPHLCEALGVEVVQETPKVRVLRPRA